MLHCNITKNTDYFTGQINYSYQYESSILNTDSLAQIRPKKSEFRYDLLNYQSIFFGKDTIAYYYDSALNKCLAVNKNNFECEDYSIQTDSIKSFKVYDAKEKILGQACTVLEFQGKYFWNRYYVSKELKIAPSTYNQHKAYNWKFYGEETDGGLILKLEHRFKDFTMHGMVTQIIPFPKGEKALQINKSVLSTHCQRTD